MWFLERAPRFLKERADISELEQRADWLRNVAWRVAEGLRFEVDFEVLHGDDVFKLTLTYPELFPKTPPSVLVRKAGASQRTNGARAANSASNTAPTIGKNISPAR